MGVRHYQSMTEKLEEQSVKQDDVLEGVAYLVQRDKEKDPELARVQGLGDKSLLTSLSQDLLKLCLSIERHVGGLGSKFAESLLGETLELMEISGDHGFLTRRTFWLLVRRWREVSLLPDSPVPFTLQHLQHVCSSLDPDPTTVQAITASHEEKLERNFVFLSEELDFRSIHSQLRNSGRLTEEAWEFLTDESLKSRFQKTDRLLAVVYSLGEQGYRLLRDVMEPSGHEHVLLKLTQDDSGPDDVMARPEPDTSEAETVADAGPDDDPNLTTAVPVHDDADDDAHDVQGDHQGLALQDEDRRPATAQELRGLLGSVAGILRDTGRRQEERDQAAARRTEELGQSVSGRMGEMNERMNTQMAALEARLAASTGAVQREVRERLEAAAERQAAEISAWGGRLAQENSEQLNAVTERQQTQLHEVGKRVAEVVRAVGERLDGTEREMASVKERMTASSESVMDQMSAVEKKTNTCCETVLEELKRMGQQSETAARRVDDVCEELLHSRGGGGAAERGRGLERQTCAGRESLEAAETQRERGSAEETAGGAEKEGGWRNTLLRSWWPDWLDG